ncbi:MAG: hypothetical protein V1747_02565 [Candidatus Omnitrophota bacterium]
MDGLFKLIFYIIIGIVWVLSSAKKQEQRQEQKPNLPKTPLRSNKLRPILRLEQQPERQDAFSDQPSPALFGEFKKSYYDEKLDMKKKRLQNNKKKQLIADSIKITLGPDGLEEVPEPEQGLPSIPAVVSNLRQKQTLHLKSSLKEGIIWSIVLGAPRSKQIFNRLQIPLNR